MYVYYTVVRIHILKYLNSGNKRFVPLHDELELLALLLLLVWCAFLRTRTGYYNFLLILMFCEKPEAVP